MLLYLTIIIPRGNVHRRRSYHYHVLIDTDDRRKCIVRGALPLDGFLPHESVCEKYKEEMMNSVRPEEQDEKNESRCCLNNISEFYMVF